MNFTGTRIIRLRADKPAGFEKKKKKKEKEKKKRKRKKKKREEKEKRKREEIGPEEVLQRSSLGFTCAYEHKQLIKSAGAAQTNSSSGN